jgi:murein L,D-transpeptidase YafK
MKKQKYITLSIFATILGLTTYYFYPEEKLQKNIVVDKIIVYKSKRQLLAYSNGLMVKTYKISLGGNPLGAKAFEDDQKTPEGLYYINEKNTVSNYHKKLVISYPNLINQSYAKKMSKNPGSNILIHGLHNKLRFLGKFQRWYDWTDGCIALTNEEVDELYMAVKIGTPIEIKP